MDRSSNSKSAFWEMWAPWLVICLWMTALAYPPFHVLRLLTDSEQYEQAAQQIESGELFRASPEHKPSLGVAIRPPVYPLALIAARLLGRGNLEAGIVGVHLVAALLCLFAAKILLRSYIHPLVAVAATGFALFSSKQIMWSHMSEWLAACWMLLVWLGFARWCFERTPRNAGIISISLCMMILTRIAMATWVFLVPLVVLFAPKGLRIRHAVVACIWLLPLVAWAWFNQQRLGVFTLSPHGAYQLVATARTLGEIPVDGSDSPEVRHLVESINQAGQTPPDESMIPERVHEWNGAFYFAYHHNFDVSCALMYQSTLDPTLMTKVARTLLWRTISAHRDRYQNFLLGSIHRFVFDYGSELLACLLTSLMLLYRRGRREPLVYAGIVMVFGATIYMWLFFGNALWVHRYFVPIQPALFTATVLSLAAIVTSYVTGARPAARAGFRGTP
jgi:hypothetical protein